MTNLKRAPKEKTFENIIYFFFFFSVYTLLEVQGNFIRISFKKSTALMVGKKYTNTTVYQSRL